MAEMIHPYLPSTDEEREAMLSALGVASIEDLLAQVPEALRWRPGKDAPPGGLLDTPLTEPALMAEARRRAEQNVVSGSRPCFLGAGTYHHYIPAVVPHLATRSEFLTAYTPYQPEASQGLLQATFEYQTAVARLTGMDVSNAGLYDGATALAEAVLMGFNLKPKSPRIVLSRGIHPQYRQVVRTHVESLGAEVVEVDLREGITPEDAWRSALGEKDTTALAVVQSPNFLGCLEGGKLLVAAAHAAGALACVVFNPIALGALATPGQWEADLAVGEGQPLGLAAAAGGETLGLFATRKEYVWKMPGRLVGLTRDRLDRRAYVLTLQSREQHIRRARATSNICTNQALYALMAAIYLATVGPGGLREVAAICAARSAYARKRIQERAGLRPAFSAPSFHEFALRVGRDAEAAAEILADKHGILAGYPLGRDYPELEDCLLICTTELTPTEDIDRLADALASLP